jgi:hypothetical protein
MMSAQICVDLTGGLTMTSRLMGTPALILSVLFLLPACLQLDGLGDGTASRFSQGVPNPDNVVLSIPADPLPNGLRVGETAEYWSQTMRKTSSVNGSVDGLLSAIRRMAELEPYEESETQAVWGPVTPDDSEITSMLVITETGPGQFDFDYQIRPASSDDDADFRSLIAGSNTVLDQPGSQVAERGFFVLDWTNFNAVDPEFEFVGTMTVHYDASDGAFRSVEVIYADFHSAVASDGVLSEPVDMTYRYLRYVDGAGELQFAFAGNVHDDAEAKPLEETYRVRSRWTTSGAGRADVRISGTDVATDLAEQGLTETEVALSECWDDGFLRVFFERSPAGSEDDGEAAACVLTDSLFADDDIDLM